MKFNVKIEDVINKNFEEEEESYCNWNNYIVRKIVDDSVYSRLLKHEYSLRTSKKSNHSTRKRMHSKSNRKTIKNSRGHAIL